MDLNLTPTPFSGDGALRGKLHWQNLLVEVESLFVTVDKILTPCPCMAQQSLRLFIVLVHNGRMILGHFPALELELNPPSPFVSLLIGMTAAVQADRVFFGDFASAAITERHSDRGS